VHDVSFPGGLTAPSHAKACQQYGSKSENLNTGVYPTGMQDRLGRVLLLVLLKWDPCTRWEVLVSHMGPAGRHDQHCCSPADCSCWQLPWARSTGLMLCTQPPLVRPNSR
jgi:hypothetical protein